MKNLCLKYADWICAFSCLILSLAYIFEVSAFPVFGIEDSFREYVFCFKGLDSAEYIKNGMGLFDGSWPGNSPFYFMPLYSFIIAAQSLFSTDVFYLVCANAFIAAITVFFCVRLAGKLFGVREAYISGILLILYPGFMMYLAIPLSSVYETFFSVMTLLMLFEWNSSKLSLRAAFMYGLFGALLSLLRPNFMLVIPLAAVFLWILSYRETALFFKSLRPCLLSAFSFLLVLLPVLIWNNLHSEHFMLISANAGATYAAGNSDPAGNLLSPLSSSYWWHLLGKVYELFSAYEFPDNAALEFYRDYSAILSFMPLSFGMFAGLFTASVLLFAKDWKRLWPLYLIPSLYALTIVLFVVIGRYRLPMLPFMCIIGAGFIVAVLNGLRNWPVFSKREKTCFVAALCSFMLIFILSSPFQSRVCPPVYVNNAGLFAAKKLDLSSFIDVNRRFGSMNDKESLQIKMNLAVASVLKGDFDSAFQLYREMLNSNQDNAYIMKTAAESRLFMQASLNQIPKSSWSEYLKTESSKAFFAEFFKSIMEIADKRESIGLPIPEEILKLREFR